MSVDFDVFISHASEDKQSVARPLAKLLEKAGLNVWLDDTELPLGDSLRTTIDRGIAASTYGIVVLFFTAVGDPSACARLQGVNKRLPEIKKWLAEPSYGPEDEAPSSGDPSGAEYQAFVQSLTAAIAGSCPTK